MATRLAAGYSRQGAGFPPVPTLQKQVGKAQKAAKMAILRWGGCHGQIWKSPMKSTLPSLCDKVGKGGEGGETDTFVRIRWFGP
jgi:hypothetical protein